MIWPLLVLSISLVSSIDGQKLHEHLTNEEIQSVFYSDHDKLHKLNYEVIKIFHEDNQKNLELTGRGESASTPVIRLQAFDQDYTLYLEGNNDVLLGEKVKLYLANVEDSNIVYTEMDYPVPDNLKLYHDIEKRAAVTLQKDSNNRVHVDGIVGDNLVIRSLPERVHKEVLPNHPTVAKEQIDPFGVSFFQPTHHVVYISTQNQMNFNGLGNQLYQQPINQQPLYTYTQFLPTNWPIQQPIDNQLHQQHNQVHQQMMANARTNANQLSNTQQPINQQPLYTYTQLLPTIWPIQQPIDNQLYQQHNQVHQQTLAIARANANRLSNIQQPIYQQPLYTITQYPFTNEQQRIYQQPSFPVTLCQFSNWPIVHQRPPAIRQSVASQPPVTSTLVADTVYLQLRITSDYETFAIHGNSNEAVAKYMAAFWNAVDLRFREISNPKIRLNIAGLIIPQTSDAVSYMNKHIVGEKTIDAEKTLDEISNYFNSQSKFPKTSSDITVAITKRTMVAYHNGVYEDKIYGIAYVGSACNTENGKAVALVRDEGGFKGITTAAHELAHTLGVPHDGQDSSTIPGGPCAWSDGYLMSYNHQGSNSVHWSQCSITAMRQFLLSDNAQCLRNKPDVGKPHPKILPGKILSRDEQCSRTMPGTVSYKILENDCAILWCAKYTGTIVSVESFYQPPAEGSPCEQGGICLNAKCVQEPGTSN